MCDRLNSSDLLVSSSVGLLPSGAVLVPSGVVLLPSGVVLLPSSPFAGAVGCGGGDSSDLLVSSGYGTALDLLSGTEFASLGLIGLGKYFEN